MRYLFSFIFALGILLDPFHDPLITYSCTGPEMFPTFYGSPFIYKATSLASSLEFIFYFTGIIANVLAWMLLVLFLRFILYKTILKYKNKAITYSYIGLKFMVTVYFLFCILLTYKFGGDMEFSIDFTKEAKDWGMTCGGHFSFTE